MQTLEPLVVPSDIGCTLARLVGDYEGPLRRFVCSTEETQSIVNKPEIMGVQYTEYLERGMAKILRAYKAYQPFPIEEEHTDVLHFLRGGLNFGLREALYDAYGWNRTRASFLSSQRAQDKLQRWYIQENSYRKIAVGKGSSLFCADVVATGVTLEHGLETLTEILQKNGSSIRSFHFFTIGCHKTEKVLEHFHTLWKKVFPDFFGIDLFYIEGKFHLADSKTATRIKIQGTDLLRLDSPLMPAFIAAQEQSVTPALERCTIYDAGSRAYDTDEYRKDVVEYWSEVLALAEQGVTTQEYLHERYPEASPELRALAEATPLRDICKERIHTLR